MAARQRGERASDELLLHANASLEKSFLGVKATYPQLSQLTEKSVRDLVPPADLSLQSIRDAIPRHCFERSLVTSLAYTFYNLFLCYLVHSIGWGIWHGTWSFRLKTTGLASILSGSQDLGTEVLAGITTVIYFAVYALIQGTVVTGIWMLGHECGHGAFSPYEKVNDFIGWVLHSSLFVPYFAWQYSHSQHHRYTGSIERDTAYAPKTEKDVKQKDETFIFEAGDQFLEHFDEIGVGAAPLFIIVLRIFRMVTIGWPVYLWLGIRGGPSWQKALQASHDLLIGKLSHFRTDSPVFSEVKDQSEKNKIVYYSNLGIALVFLTLMYIAIQTSLVDVIRFYGGPLMIVNMWLVLITFLHHTDITLPHYGHVEDQNEGWSYVRGALSTMDRGSYGVIIDHLHHHIASTHVVHHLFAKIPFYHAKEATAAIKKVLGKYYRSDGVGFLAQKGDEVSQNLTFERLCHDAVLSYGKCEIVKGSGPVYFFFPQSKQ